MSIRHKLRQIKGSIDEFPRTLMEWDIRSGLFLHVWYFAIIRPFQRKTKWRVSKKAVLVDAWIDVIDTRTYGHALNRANTYPGEYRIYRLGKMVDGERELLEYYEHWNDTDRSWKVEEH